MGKQQKQWLTLFSWAPKSLQMVTAAMKLKDAPWKESDDQPRQHIKKQRHYFAKKGLSNQSYGFSSSLIGMWELDHKKRLSAEELILLNVVLEESLDSPLHCMEIKAVNPKGNQPWIFIGRTNVEAEAPIRWLPDVKNLFIRKDPDAGKDWMQEEKGTIENEMVGWHHQLSGHDFQQALGDGEGHGSLVCCSPWGRKVGHIWATELNLFPTFCTWTNSFSLLGSENYTGSLIQCVYYSLE